VQRIAGARLGRGGTRLFLAAALGAALLLGLAMIITIFWHGGRPRRVDRHAQGPEKLGPGLQPGVIFLDERAQLLPAGAGRAAHVRGRAAQRILESHMRDRFVYAGDLGCRPLGPVAVQGFQPDIVLQRRVVLCVGSGGVRREIVEIGHGLSGTSAPPVPGRPVEADVITGSPVWLVAVGVSWSACGWVGSVGLRLDWCYRLEGGWWVGGCCLARLVSSWLVWIAA
jgi:hypothetical protein